MTRAAWIAVGLAAVLGLGYAVTRAVPGPDYPAVALDRTRARPQGDFYRSAVPEPPSLNPFTTHDAVATRYVLRYTHDTLVDFDPATGDVRPALAERWDATDGGRTWTFRLRDGLRFSDGAPLTVEDLRFTLDTARHPALDAASQSEMSLALSELDAAEAPDARTLVFHLPEPRAFALRSLGAAVRIAQRRAFVDAVARIDPAAAADPSSAAFIRALVQVRDPGPGTGPYRLADWQPTHLDLVQNPASWRRRAQPSSWNLAGMRLAFLTDEAAKFAALRQQEIDWFVSGSGAGLAAEVAADPELDRHFVVHRYDNPAIGSYYVMWNHAHGALGDPRVRRALSMLFDRQTIAREVFGGDAVPRYGWFGNDSPEVPEDLGAIPFSTLVARELLTQAGFGPDGGRLQIEILCAAEVPTLQRIIEFARPAFAEAGVELAMQTLDYGAVYARQTSGEFDALVLLDYRSSTNDPYDFFESSQNLMGWNNARADALLSAAHRELDDQKRIALYRDFERLLRAEEPVTFLVHPLVEVALHRRFRDADPGPLGLIPERWWVPADEQIVRVTPP